MSNSRTADKFVIRLSPGLRDKYRDMAKRNGRSMNSEMVRALEAGLDAEEKLTEIATRLDQVEQRLEALGQ